jgi:hypothetical protein
MLGRANPVFIANSPELLARDLLVVQVIDVGRLFHAAFGRHVVQIWDITHTLASTGSETLTK